MVVFPRLYNDFAKYYDQLESQYRNYEEESEWIRSILVSNGSHRLIDISCGTGRHIAGLEEYESSRFEIAAMDASQKMIEIARERVDAKRTSLVTADFLEIPFKSESFDTAICMYWSLAGLDHPQVKQLFKEVSRILEPSGIFIFDVENAEGIKMNLINEPFIDAFFSDPDTGSNVIRANLSKKVEEDMVDWHAFYLIEMDGVSKLEDDHMRLRFYARSTLESFLKEEGFDSFSIASSPGGSYEKGSPSLYFVSRKKKS